MYRIRYSEGVADDVRRLPANQRAQMLDRIEVQLKYEATRQTRNRKILVGLVPPWDHLEPVWELRVGEHRVFYDVDEAGSTVIIRAIRHKPPHLRTEEIL
ncbi:MAG: type II toxin-antitoxin system RelE/ParE family toxin [Acidobacteria bacterium]|nr:type II toxin-antitoxin system RelE/ParE family toxin [Acidobacteriota bacterium]